MAVFHEELVFLREIQMQYDLTVHDQQLPSLLDDIDNFSYILESPVVSTVSEPSGCF